MRLWDISQPIGPETAPYPGDAPFSHEWVLRRHDGAPCNVGTIRMSAHLGTHADAPLHFEDDGVDAASIDLGAYLGRCRVVDVRGGRTANLVCVAELSAAFDGGVERVLLRTRERADHRVYDPGHRALEPAAAQALAAAGVRLVGIDTPSVDPGDSEDFAAHRALRAGGVAILENLDLAGVPAGDYELIALPLRLVGADGSPVRAVLRQLPAGPGPS